MGTITRSFANNITTSGVLLPASLVNNSIANVTAYNAAIATGNMVLISSQTASNSASISFTTGINSTYKEYQFYYINIRPETDDSYFSFQTSTDSGSNYGVTCTSSCFKAFRSEASGETAGNNYEFGYRDDSDLAQSTSFQRLNADGGIGNDADQNASGYISLFNPSSTTYVKHFTAVTNTATAGNYTVNAFFGGYFNTTSALNAVQFKMESGNFNGTILMYGIV